MRGRVTGVVVRPKKPEGDRNQFKMQFILDAEAKEKEARDRAITERWVSDGRPMPAGPDQPPREALMTDPKTGLIVRVKLTPDGYTEG